MYMKILISESQFEKLIKKVKDGERFIKCDSCHKWFTQTFHKGKKSLPICPWCGRHNTQFNENQEVDERSRSLAFTRKKRLFSKPEMMANPDRYKEHDKELKEIDRYKFSELGPKYRKDDPEENYREYQHVIENYGFYKEVNGFRYYYTVYDEHSGEQMVGIYVTDPLNKLKVGEAEFEMKYANQFFITLPFVRKEYRKRGIATEIYKIVLNFGELVSGKVQSDQAVGLWKKLMRELPNKVVFVDDSGKEFGVELKNNDIIVSETGESVYNDKKGGFLKMYETE